MSEDNNETITVNLFQLHLWWICQQNNPIGKLAVLWRIYLMKDIRCLSYTTTKIKRKRDFYEVIYVTLQIRKYAARNAIEIRFCYKFYQPTMSTTTTTTTTAISGSVQGDVTCAQYIKSAAKSSRKTKKPIEHGQNGRFTDSKTYLNSSFETKFLLYTHRRFWWYSLWRGNYIDFPFGVCVTPVGSYFYDFTINHSTLFQIGFFLYFQIGVFDICFIEFDFFASY